MEQSEVYLTAYWDYCCFWGAQIGRIPCSKYIHTVTITTTILPSDKCTLYYRVVQAYSGWCGSEVVINTTKYETRSNFENARNGNVCLRQQPTSIEALGKKKGKRF